jgi:type IV pilus assembly protein PilP
MKLTGIIVGLDKHKAILMTPNGKTHIIGVGTKIGVRKGFVKKITPTSIVVRERFANVFGKEENIDTEIKLPEKRN